MADQPSTDLEGSPTPDPVSHRIPIHVSGWDCTSRKRSEGKGRGWFTRRRVLGGAGATLLASFAGCAGLDGGSTPAAVSVGNQTTCDVCGMIIRNHPGPTAQIFYADHDPETHDPPFLFDSLKACAFDHYFIKKRNDWSIEAFYVTDYSTVDYTVSEKGGKAIISSHGTPESFATAKSVSYVVDGDVYGAMGRDFVPFSDEEDASNFVDEYGGEVVSFGDITPATLK